MVAHLVIDHDGVFDKEAIEAHGSAADGAGEGVLQQPHVVLIDVNILKDLLQCCVDHLTRGQQLVDAGVLLAMYDVLLRVWVFAENMLCYGLADRERHDYLACVWTDFRVCPPVELRTLRGVHVRGVHGRAAVVVQGEGNLLIACVLVEVVILQLCALAGSHHALHQLHGGVVLSGIVLAFCFHHDFLHL